MLQFIIYSGTDLVQALENGVSQYPKLEGRFPQISGVSFTFDPSKPAGQRVEPSLVKVLDEYVNFEKVKLKINHIHLFVSFHIKVMVKRVIFSSTGLSSIVSLSVC